MQLQKRQFLAKICEPDSQEAMHWLDSLVKALGGDMHLDALGLSPSQIEHWRALGTVPRAGRRHVWTIWSVIFCPSNLSNLHHFITWGRFNPEMRNSYKLLAIKWLRRRSRARNLELNISNIGKGQDGKPLDNQGLAAFTPTRRPWRRHKKRPPEGVVPVLFLPLLTG